MTTMSVAENDALDGSGVGVQAGAMRADEDRTGQETPAHQLRRELLDDDLIAEVVERAGAGGIALTGQGGFLPELIRAVLERGLATELSDHLDYDKGDAAGRGAPYFRTDGDRPTITIADSLRRTPLGDLVLVPPKTFTSRRTLEIVFSTEVGTPLDPSNVRRTNRIATEAGIAKGVQVPPHPADLARVRDDRQMARSGFFQPITAELDRRRIPASAQAVAKRAPFGACASRRRLVSRGGVSLLVECLARDDLVIRPRRLRRRSRSDRDDHQGRTRAPWRGDPNRHFGPRWRPEEHSKTTTVSAQRKDAG